LNGKNYLGWAQSVKLAIDGRSKLSHLNGEVSKLAADDLNLKTWRSNNSLLIAWLINSIKPTIGKPHLFLPIAKDVWEAIHDKYSDLEISSQIFYLKSKLWHIKYGYTDKIYPSVVSRDHGNYFPSPWHYSRCSLHTGIPTRYLEGLSENSHAS
jgi:hypothetical protein